MDTSQLIRPHNLFLPDRVACFIDQEQEMNIVHGSDGKSQKNVLAKMFNEHTFLTKDMDAERRVVNSNRCLIQRDMNLFNLITFDRLFFVCSQTVMVFLFILLSMVRDNEDTNIWISDAVLHEYNLVTLYSVKHSYNLQRYSRM